MLKLAYRNFKTAVKSMFESLHKKIVMMNKNMGKCSLKKGNTSKMKVLELESTISELTTNEGSLTAYWRCQKKGMLNLKIKEFTQFAKERKQRQ